MKVVKSEHNLTKWLIVYLRTKWLLIQDPLQSLKFQIARLLRAKSSLTCRKLQSEDPLLTRM